MKSLSSEFCVVVEKSIEMPSLELEASSLRALLDQNGCVIFRNFDASIEDFERVTSTITDEFQTYRGGGFTVGRLARATVNNNSTLMTATGDTQNFGMPLHGEMYYLGNPPDLIWFYCQIPVAEGGQTTIGNGRQIFRDLPRDIAELFRGRRVLYERRVADGDWQQTFQTDSRDDVEAFCAAKGLEFEWDEQNGVVTRFATLAIRDSDTEAPAFINSVLLLAYGELAMQATTPANGFSGANKIGLIVRWEDRSPISPDILKQIDRACRSNEIEVSWQRGDIILVDNRWVMHGRRESSGKERKILVRMGNIKEAY